MTESRARWAVAAVIVGSLIVRLWTISERSLWFDEAFSYTLACESTWAEMVARTATDVHPPLSYALLCLWSHLAGTSVVGLRLFSVFWSVMTLIGCYLFCRDAFSRDAGCQETAEPAPPLLAGNEPRPSGSVTDFRKHSPESLPHGRGSTAVARFEQIVIPDGRLDARWIGVSAAALIAACSLHIKWSQEVRMYTLGTALVFFSTWMLVRALRPEARKLWWWTGYVLCATAFAYTHNFALFSIAGQALFCVGVLVRGTWNVPHRIRPPLEEGEFVVLGDVGLARAGLSKAFPLGHSLLSGGNDKLSRALPAFAAFPAVGVAYLPWVGVLLRQTNIAAIDYWTPRFTSWTIPVCLGGLVVPTNWYGPDQVTSVVVTAAFVSVIGLLAWKTTADCWLLVAMVVTPIACATLISLAAVAIFISRYFLFAHVFLLCAVPYLGAWFLATPTRTILVGLLVSISVVGHVIYWTSLKTEKRPGIAAAVAHVVRRSQPGEEVIVTHPTIYFSARYYLRGVVAPRLLVVNGGRPHYMGGPAIPRSWSVDERGLRSAQNNRVWVIDVNHAPDGTATQSLPNDWKLVRETSESFQEVYNFLGIVSASAYERRPTEVENARVGQRK